MRRRGFNQAKINHGDNHHGDQNAKPDEKRLFESVQSQIFLHFQFLPVSKPELKGCIRLALIYRIKQGCF